MSKMPSQDFKRHGRFVPGFHGVTFILLLINAIWMIRGAIRSFSLDTLVPVLTAVALILLFLYARVFATQNQDRIIRLEERLRLERLLPDDLRPRVHELTTGQLIGLRFASDDEVGELTKKVLTEGITNRQEIKRKIRQWRADYQRV